LKVSVEVYKRILSGSEFQTDSVATEKGGSSPLTTGSNSDEVLTRWAKYNGYGGHPAGKIAYSSIFAFSEDINADTETGQDSSDKLYHINKINTYRPMETRQYITEH